MEDGRLDLSAMSQSDERFCCSWVRFMASKSPDIACHHKSVPLATFLEVLAKFKHIRPLLQQVLFQVASSYEVGMADLDERKFDMSNGNFMMQLYGYCSSAILQSQSFNVPSCLCIQPKNTCSIINK